MPMTMVKPSWILFGCIGVGVALGLGACGGGGSDASTAGTDAGNAETGGGDDSGFDLEAGPGANIDSIVVSPATATLTSLDRKSVV